MADRAEERALSIICSRCVNFSRNCGMLGNLTNCKDCNKFIQGYHQAEKDVALTWQDMMLIHRCIKDAMNYNLYKMMEGVEGQKEVYQNVLKRFLESKKL